MQAQQSCDPGPGLLRIDWAVSSLLPLSCTASTLVTPGTARPLSLNHPTQHAEWSLAPREQTTRLPSHLGPFEGKESHRAPTLDSYPTRRGSRHVLAQRPRSRPECWPRCQILLLHRSSACISMPEATGRCKEMLAARAPRYAAPRRRRSQVDAQAVSSVVATFAELKPSAREVSAMRSRVRWARDEAARTHQRQRRLNPARCWERPCAIPPLRDGVFVAIRRALHLRGVATVIGGHGLWPIVYGAMYWVCCGGLLASTSSSFLSASPEVLDRRRHLMFGSCSLLVLRFAALPDCRRPPG